MSVKVASRFAVAHSILDTAGTMTALEQVDALHGRIDLLIFRGASFAWLSRRIYGVVAGASATDDYRVAESIVASDDD